MSENNFTLPPAPSDLCFTAEDFMALDFDVDNFLHEHRKNASLETMRDDLGVYLKILRSAMIELINKDYADFVNLSKDLIGLDKVINHLQAPLGQLREEVMQICQTLDTATEDMENGLKEHQRIRDLKQSMHSLGRVYKSASKLKLILESHVIKLDILERAATEFNQLRFHMTRCKDYMSEDLKKNCENLEIQLLDSLDSQLLLCIKSNHNCTDNLICCLRIYVTLDKIDKAEHLVRKKIVGVLIEDIIVEKNINNELLGLQELYQKLLKLLDVELKKLLEVTFHSNITTARNFNFLVNSFWSEVEEKIELRLKQIFAPGNPDLFYKRYTESLEFINKLQEKCKNNDNLAQLKCHPLFIQFIKKWNLPVYFQIRFQEIAGSVEQVLCHHVSQGSIKINVTNLDPTDTDTFSLYGSETTWDCLMKTWSEGIFISQLLHQFWKLNLQILSRYRTWISDALKQSWIKEPRPVAMNSNIINPEPPNRLEFLVCLYTDLEKISKKLPTLLDVVVRKLSISETKIITLLKESLDDMKTNLLSDLPKITEEIVQELLANSSPELKKVSDIPRSYRRTNREPTEPCAYIKNALGVLVEFHSTYQNIVPGAVIHWLQLTLSLLSEQYYSSVKNVLESVQKTEESLRRLKIHRDKSSKIPTTETQGVTDDDKIRIQLEKDVLYFADTVNTFNIDRYIIKDLEKLTEVVDAAVKSRNESKS
ncbi:Similar to COG2: Conserved oligomeric Golgi complex subunit 2 (Homo sapiens) [Cotesia congregata]|uniref:Conserved oligomeric Golgi complex subunit 2 n=1 Tax=Cotesia congregata TaxID=51543 RepID=A0A8J2HRA2_COTCN|nr:Similar to COG2: Conserved oligomeric Golgi complex subunit 2 (Homo sapiens) [Cotesia congregata]